MKTPRAILFDLDDTIISAYSRPEAAWLAVCTEFADQISPLQPNETASLIMHAARDFWSDPEQHKYWRARLLQSRREVVKLAFSRLPAGSRAPSDSVRDAIADRFTAYRDENMRLFPGAHEVIDHFKARGVKLALVTNGAGVDQRAKIVRFDLGRRFDHIQIEGEHGFGKPEERAYLHAMETLGVPAHETWMVGDNLEWEVRAPQKLGIYAIWHDVLGEGLPKDANVTPDRIIRSLGELV